MDIQDFTSLPALFEALANARGDAPLFSKREGSKTVTFTREEALAGVRAIAAVLLRQDFKPGDRAAVMSENGPELTFCDLAIQELGGVVVPIYTTSSARQIQHILSDSDPVIFLFDKGAALPRIREALDRLAQSPPSNRKAPPSNRKAPQLIRMRGHGDSGADGISNLPALLADAPTPAELETITQRLAGLTRNDLSVLIYTSGTTGPPKGVMLTHGNILSNIDGTLRVLDIFPEDLFLSFLPMSHAFERSLGHYAVMAAGARIHYARSIGTVIKDFAEAAPTVVLVVPRFLEKMRQRVLQAFEELTPPMRRIMKAALHVRLKRAARIRRNEPVPILLNAACFLAGLTGIEKVKKKLGGRLRSIASGGAPLAPELWEFFEAIGLKVLQGYGLTETGPVISVNPPGRNKPASVGPPIDNVSVRIANDGEIEVSGPAIMKGYWNLPEETAAAFTDEVWFKTGDVGRLDEDGYLYITDRKKDIIVSAGGKNISPQNLENALCMHPLVEFACVLGEGRRFLGAILSPNPDPLAQKIRELGLEKEDPIRLIQTPEVLRLYQEVVDGVNQTVSSHEKIKRFRLAKCPFSIEGGEVTPTMKVRRREIEKIHAGEIHELFNP